MPAVLQVLAGSTLLNYLGLFAVLNYSMFVFLSFVYPTMMVFGKAKTERDSILNQTRYRYHEIAGRVQMEELDPIPRIAESLRANTVRSEYDDVKRMRLYPLRLDIILKLGVSVVLPVILPLAIDFLSVQLGLK